MKSAKFVSALAVAAILGSSLGAVAQGAMPGKGAPGPRPAEGAMMMISPIGLGWSMADTNADGKVAAEEADAALKARFAKADANGDGLLSPEELAAAIKAMEEERADQRRLELAKRLIDRADDNGDGNASADELRVGRGAADFIKRFDTDGDGTVTKAEYDAKMKALHDRFAKRGGQKDHPRGPGKGGPAAGPDAGPHGPGKGPFKGQWDEHHRR